MRFEYDKLKSISNRKKHGIDFEEAQELWNGTVADLLSKFKEEPRRLIIGQLNAKFWTAIITERGDSIRIISLRRARDEERRLYEEITKNQ